MDLEDDLPDDDIDLEEDGPYGLGSAAQQSAGNDPDYSSALRAAIEKHAEAAQARDWSQCADCVGRVVALSEAQPGLMLLALADLASDMCTAVSEADEEETGQHGQASSSGVQKGGEGCDGILEEGLWAERCRALREASVLAGERLEGHAAEEVGQEALVRRGRAAGLVMAWALQGRSAKAAAAAEQVSKQGGY